MKMKHINITRIQAVKDKSISYETNHITSPEVAIGIINKFIQECCHTDRENFIVMCLDTKNKVTAMTLASVGTLNSTNVHPREVFKTAILANSASIILAHNHPSGDSAPSKEDMEVTRRLKEAGKIMGIEILDHIIIGDEKTTSLKANGLI
jgi:DNA repair protein RadC